MKNFITDYQFIDGISKLNINKVSNLLIANDMGRFGLIKNMNKIESFSFIYKSLLEINPKITIIVPTATLNLVNTKLIYDNKNTPSYQMGSFSEFIRNLPNSKRSFHPFWSLSAIGPNSLSLTENVSANPYDNNSVFSRLYNLSDSHFMSLGNHPRFMLSIIHHIELINKVPYRYIKKFKQFFLNKNNEVVSDEFELYVLKKEFINKKRFENKKIFENFEMNDDLNHINILNRDMFIFSINNFYKITQMLFKKDINCWWK